jgi:hypothetical protein
MRNIIKMPYKDKEKQKQWNLNNKEKMKLYYLNNKENIIKNGVYNTTKSGV